MGQTAPLKILYITGHGRCGSTLLERILAQAPGFVAVGELVQLWTRTPTRAQLCGCGLPLGECAVWNGVVEDVFGGWEALHPAELRRLKFGVDRVPHIPEMLSPLKTKQYRLELERYLGTRVAVYRSLQQRSEADIIVDSSKDASTLLLLAQRPDIDLRVVHLVRDSRGVAFSWMRKDRRILEITWEERYMPTFSPIRVSLQYLSRNIAAELSRGRARVYQRLRYEDFAESPRKSLDAITHMAEVDPVSAEVLDDHWAHLARTSHTLGGNPVRFQAGAVEIRADLEWQREMKLAHRLIVAAITAPLLARYGYPLIA